MIGGKKGSITAPCETRRKVQRGRRRRDLVSSNFGVSGSGLVPSAACGAVNSG